MDASSRASERMRIRAWAISVDSVSLSTLLAAERAAMVSCNFLQSISIDRARSSASVVALAA